MDPARVLRKGKMGVVVRLILRDGKRKPVVMRDHSQNDALQHQQMS